ncbi:cytochrome C [Arenibacter sp. GZD96]|uniref:hypothetical protein n=1 Tax=Aurantibrevibacter litoralis TaxID=3106030 RepID=UPI002AFEAEB1|nr:hypothetical protein [Arenibacter sp. GZD-96]MEA1787661.1 cytochrome C [Arenibacter sp. GZD-96]
MKKRFGIISFFLILFIMFIIVWNFSYQEGLEEGTISVIESPTGTSIPTESGVFRRFDHSGMDIYAIPIDAQHQRTLKNYYTNRAYLGAPPSIPHPVKKEGSFGGNTCLQCHQNGGFVANFNAYAPVSPHPEMVNCRQCHVTKNTNTTFREFSFAKAQPPKIGAGINRAMPGSPPMIPHQLQMRENCIACHAGPSAPNEIRVTHPERINCRQCHLPKALDQTQLNVAVFQRSVNSNYEE